jgi:hypothetical protein
MITVNFLSLCFWGVLAAYIIHTVDETLMGGGFVQKVREHWWPQYHIEMFFWFNAAIIRYGLRPGLIGSADFLIATTGGFAGALFLAFLPTTIMPRISRRKQARMAQK